jgi:hypothetical protein
MSASFQRGVVLLSKSGFVPDKKKAIDALVAASASEWTRSSEVGPELARGLARAEERSVEAASKLGPYLRQNER